MPPPLPDRDILRACVYGRSNHGEINSSISTSLHLNIEEVLDRRGPFSFVLKEASQIEPLTASQFAFSSLLLPRGGFAW